MGGMIRHVARLFLVKSKFEAFLVIYALGAGAVERGLHYMAQYPGLEGRVLFALCPVAVFIAGGTLIDAVERRGEA